VAANNWIVWYGDFLQPEWLDDEDRVEIERFNGKRESGEVCEFNWTKYGSLGESSIIKYRLLPNDQKNVK